VATGSLRRGSDAELIAAVRTGEAAAFEAIMRRHNRLLFRTARAILQNEADAEEVVQETYLKAYLNLGGFAQQARLSTWLVKIAVNESLARLRRRMPGGPAGALTESQMTAETHHAAPGLTAAVQHSPEAAAAQGEIRRLLEAAIDALPQAQRAVFMLRAVEEFSTEDTADCLGIPADTVKTRLHRAKLQLRRSLQRSAAAALGDTFPFAGQRCDRIVAGVLDRLAPKPPDG
jgi:RNA polymerase sigma-70 factor (ECF subfamily)